MADNLPRKAAARTARLAALPLGYAGRTAVGLGRRIGGAPAETVMTEIQQRTAEQLFRTLGELKGGAMKFGQALLGVFMLILDFDFVEQGIANQIPERESWRAAFAMTVSLVWIYTNLLRLLAIFSQD